MNIELAPKAYWKQLTLNEAILYCFSLNINGKIGWRLPTRLEYNLHDAIQPTALFQEQLEVLRQDFNFPTLVIPVRDL